MSNSRFEELLGRCLDEDLLSSEEWTELLELIREDPTLQEELGEQFEASELLALSEDDLRHVSLFLAATRSRLRDLEFMGRVRLAISNATQTVTSPDGRPPARQILQRIQWPWVITLAAATVALVAVIFSFRSTIEPEIAEITELNGSIIWIGDGGRVVRDLDVGTSLSGGTIEALTADAWVALEFRDGSTVKVPGPSMLTISEHGQKEMHLREGTLFATVTEQLTGKPMLIHTRTAEVEVLGTKLNVEAGSLATRLSVDEGRVRLKRLVDGSVTEVPADHQVLATADGSETLIAMPRPEAVNRWESDLMASMGKVLSPNNNLPARLRTLPIVFNSPDVGPFTLYIVRLNASQCGLPPVVLEKGGRLRVRGRIESAQDVHIEITTKKQKGGFGGKFETVIPASTFAEAGELFEVEIGLGDLVPQHPWVSRSPIGSELENTHVFTVNVDAGLEIVRIELLPPS